MSLQGRIKEDLMGALKSKNPEKSSVLRMLQAAIKNREIELNRAEMSDEYMLEVIAKEAKRRREAAVEYRKGGRQDLAEKEEREFGILSGYLPEQISDEELEKTVREEIALLNAGKDDFGKIMGSLSKKLKGKAEGGRIRAFVEKELK